MRRIISLWFPLWATDLRQCQQKNNKLLDSPFVLTHSENQTQKLYAVCPVSAAKGLHVGMTLAEARMVVPDLHVEAATPSIDEVRREELARWLVRYTPLTACDSSDKDSLILDASGCAHLFGGEKAMLADIQSRLKKSGLSVQYAMAENRAVAWALSHYRPGSISSSSAESKEFLAPLPVCALRLDRATEVTLNRLGLKTIGSLFAIPRSTLAQRFRGIQARHVTDLLCRLDQMLGRVQEPFSPLVPVAQAETRQAFSEPVMHLPMLEVTIKALLDRLIKMLCEAEAGIRRLSLVAFRVDGSLQQLIIGTNRPSRDKDHLFYLIQEKLDQLQSEFGFDCLLLRADETEHLPPSQYGDNSREKRHSTFELLDRLTIRLGAAAVQRLQHNHSHQPERAQALVPANTTSLAWESVPKNKAPRPVRLLSRPEPIEVLAEVPEGAPRRFRWRRIEHYVVKADGPERIAPEWWVSKQDKSRDYYRVEADTGARFWLFRRGLYPISGVRRSSTEEITASPAWYMHGFFA